MKIKGLIVIALFSLCSFSLFHKEEKHKILSHIVDLKQQNLKLYWKDDSGKNLSNFKRLKEYLINDKKEELIFAMNGGMYLKDRSPQGLFIENGIIKKKMNNVQSAYGNFYLQPNGVFFITDTKEGGVCPSYDFSYEGVRFATQSGPMLVIDGKIHSKFTKGSRNLNIRNGVGILPDGKLIFAMSMQEINLYDFASYFKSLGCKNALYLDGFVSRTYLPSKNWISTDGNFGVMIGETKN